MFAEPAKLAESAEFAEEAESDAGAAGVLVIEVADHHPARVVPRLYPPRM